MWDNIKKSEKSMGKFWNQSDNMAKYIRVPFPIPKNGISGEATD